MRVLKINLRFTGIILVLLAGGTAAMVRAHQVGRLSYPYRGDEAAADSAILINSQQAISVQPVPRLSQ